ncbi:MAG: spermidine/putrescine ABC transporter substrate-binding protein, partial [Leisingera sp.]
SAEASGKYIIESWGYAHSNADAFAAADPELVKTYGFADVNSFFEGSLFFDAVKPELEGRMLKEFERIKAGF